MSLKIMTRQVKALQKLDECSFSASTLPNNGGYFLIFSSKSILLFFTIKVKRIPSHSNLLSSMQVQSCTERQIRAIIIVLGIMADTCIKWQVGLRAVSALENIHRGFCRQ